MKKIALFSFLFSFLILACKTDYELVRTSGDSKKILEAANNYFDQKDYSKAISLYELIIPTMRGRPGGEELAYKFADAHFLSRSYILAAHYFKGFSDTYGNSSLKEEAMFMTAYSNYKMSPKFKLDQTPSNQAVSGFQLFVNTFPNSEKVEQCNQLIDELRKKMEIKEFESGKLYYNMRKYSAAVVTLENMVNNFPGSNEEEEARYLIAKAHYLQAKNSIYNVQEERFRDALKSCERFLKKFSESKYFEEVLSYKDNSLKEIKHAQNG
ncbi:MAG: outer membrane protein assembly factor BamD [Saprospiraceae bacterium]